MPYTKVHENWEDLPSTATPINGAALEQIETGIATAQSDADALDGRVTAVEGVIGVTDHGALTGLGDDDHTQYALADGTRGAFATQAQGALADSATQPGDLGTLASQDDIAVPGDIAATGTPDASTFLRGDGAWASPAGGGSVDSVVAGTGIGVDATDPANPIVAVEAAITTKLAGIEAGAEVNDSAAEILTKLLTVDGSGSGLDADLLDGSTSAAFATAAQGTLADSATQPGDDAADQGSGAAADGHVLTADGVGGAAWEAAAGGGGSGAVTLISEQVLGSATTTVTFSSIASTYRHLRLEILARTNRSGQSLDIVRLRFNGDTASNYWNQYNLSHGTTVSGNGADVGTNGYVDLSWLPGNDAPAGSAATVTIDIPNYKGTAFHKGLHFVGGLRYSATDRRAVSGAGGWVDTAAITQIDLLSLSQFVTGSVFSLYGLS